MTRVQLCVLVRVQQHREARDGGYGNERGSRKAGNNSCARTGLWSIAMMSTDGICVTIPGAIAAPILPHPSIRMECGKESRPSSSSPRRIDHDLRRSILQRQQKVFRLLAAERHMQADFAAHGIQACHRGRSRASRPKRGRLFHCSRVRAQSTSVQPRIDIQDGPCRSAILAAPYLSAILVTR